MPRTTTAWAAVIDERKKSECERSTKAASARKRAQKRAKRNAADGTAGEMRDMTETPTFPPGNVVNVRGGTGLLTYAGTCRP